MRILLSILLLCTQHCFAGDTLTVPLNKDVQFRTFSRKYFRELSKTPSFKEQQNRARGGDFAYKDAAFRLVLIDFQSDSVFNSPYDVLTVTNTGNDTPYVAFTGISASEVRKPIYIKDGLQIFKVVEISPKGSYVKLEILHEQVPEALYVLKFMPLVNIEMLSGGKQHVASLLNHGRYIYVDFWATWCVPCVQAMPKLKALQKQFASKLIILGLNSEDKRDKALSFVKRNQLKWIQGVSDEQLRKILQVSGYPHGVLFDESGNLVAMGIEPEEIAEFLR